MFIDTETEKIINKRCVVNCFSLENDIDEIGFEHSWDAIKTGNVERCIIKVDEEVKFIKSITNLTREEQECAKFGMGKELIIENPNKVFEEPLASGRNRQFKIYILGSEKYKVVVFKKIKYIPNYQILYNVGRPV